MSRGLPPCPPVTTDTPPDWLDGKVEVDHRGCWVWTRAIQSSGYGSVGWRGRTYLAHRWAWERVNGPIPGDLTVEHLCGQQRCVNPEHMELVTRSENASRGAWEILRCPTGYPWDRTPRSPYMGGRRSICRLCRARTERSAVIGARRYVVAASLDRWIAEGDDAA